MDLDSEKLPSKKQSVDKIKPPSGSGGGSVIPVSSSRGDAEARKEDCRLEHDFQDLF
jgi:hypothetical protein